MTARGRSLTQLPPLFNLRSYAVMSPMTPRGTPNSEAAASASDDNDDVENLVDNNKNDDVDDLRDR